MARDGLTRAEHFARVRVDARNGARHVARADDARGDWLVLLAGLHHWTTAGYRPAAGYCTRDQGALKPIAYKYCSAGNALPSCFMHVQIRFVVYADIIWSMRRAGRAPESGQHSRS